MAATVIGSSPSIPIPIPLPPFLDHHRPSQLLDSLARDDAALLRPLIALARCRLPGKAALLAAVKVGSLLPSPLLGRAVHARILKAALGADRFLATSLVGFYSSFADLDSARQVFDRIPLRDAALRTALLVGCVRCGEIAEARVLFDEMQEKDVVAWNAMMSAYARCCLPEHALELFREMQRSGCRPNDVTLVAALAACSQLGCLELGEWVHAYIRRHPEVERTATLNNSLVHLYAKCGRIDAALDLFLEQDAKNLESWNTMLTGFALNGCGTTALSLFSQMIKLGMQADGITFVAILMACSHAGMIDIARRCLACMKKVYSVEPRAEHYGCLVDALARGGRLGEALSVLQSMPGEPNAPAWGALLGGCLAHGDYEMGIVAAERLIELEPRGESRYVALQNLYAMAGRGEDASRVRKMADDMGIKQSSGASTIEVEGALHEFSAGC